MADIPEFGSPYSGEFSVENAIALQADVVKLNLGGLERAKEAGMIDQLAAVGIPVVVIDYRQFPLENTVPSTILLGRLFDQEERAQKIVDFYLQQVNKVYSRIEGIEKDKPTVVDTAAGIQGAENCCRTCGRANQALWWNGQETSTSVRNWCRAGQAPRTRSRYSWPTPTSSSPPVPTGSPTTRKATSSV